MIYDHFYCECCKEYFSNKYDYEIVKEDTICSKCFYNYTIRCCICDEIEHLSKAKHVGETDSYMCRDCVYENIDEI